MTYLKRQNLRESISLQGNCQSLLDCADSKNRFDQFIAERMLERNTTFVRELLYPPNETSHLPPTLPLEAYAGVYSHPGYGDWPVTYENATLWNRIDRVNVLQYDAKLEHIPANKFLLIGYDVGELDDPIYIVTEFIVNDDGVAHQMGLMLEEEMESESIWFSRDIRAPGRKIS